MMRLEIDVEGWSNSHDWADLAQRAMQVTAEVEPALANERLSVSVLFTSDADITTLNHEWRGKDRATNVLSFPMLMRGELVALDEKGPPAMLGDIAIAFQTCMREAGEKDVALADHTAHIIVHGLLHLAGHDHETSPADAAHMEGLEIKALALMGIANPYDDAYTGRTDQPEIQE